MKHIRHRCTRWYEWLATLGILAASTALAEDPKPHIFEKEVRAYEAADAKSPPPADPIVFVGSSSIIKWNLKKSFPGLPVLSRGLDGSRVADMVYYCDRIATRYQPRAIVFYAGDNDLVEGEMTPEAILADFQQFVAKVHAELPKTRIVFISIKPSIERWNWIDSIRKTNELIKRANQSDPLVTFLDVEPAMLGDDGKPRKELFRDELHLNTRGYEVWTKLVAPHLK